MNNKASSYYIYIGVYDLNNRMNKGFKIIVVKEYKVTVLL